MNPAAAYLLSGYTITSNADIQTRKYDCAKASLCLLWCIIITCAMAYIVGLTQGDYTENCTVLVAVFGGADLIWTILAVLWASITFTRVSTENASRDILIAYFIPLYTIGINITVFHCHEKTLDLLYGWSVGWHILMTGVLFLICIMTLIRGCKSMFIPGRHVTFIDRNSDVENDLPRGEASTS